MAFTNCYQDALKAEEYAKLEFANTYFLAYRDLPEIFRRHVTGTKAIDFGCGTGRSTRFARKLGFDVIGIDISPEMVGKARQLDPEGNYHVIPDGDYSSLPTGSFDLVLSLFTFDNIPAEVKAGRFQGLARLLQPSGRLVSVVSNPAIYLHEWASFSTRDFPENRNARSGDKVRIVTTDFADRRPTVDVLCSHECYCTIYQESGLQTLAVYKPLARGDEGYSWISETTIAPWVIYVLTLASK